MKTHATKQSELKVGWHFFDATEKVVGRLSTEIVEKLMGKHKVNYVPYLNCGDKVVVTNSDKVVLTGSKEQDKLYRTHSRKLGNLKEITASQLRAKDSTKLISKAVYGMLPKNRLRDVRMTNLYIYKGPENPHHGQKDKKDA